MPDFNRIIFKISLLLKLYRVDAFLITALGFLGPTLFLNHVITLHDILSAFFISGIAVNFVYSYNAVADAEIDKVNKPHRPMAAGLLNRETALNYCYLLLFLSLILPFFVFDRLTTHLVAMVLPAIGLLYSNPWRSFKRSMFAAMLLTSVLLSLPVMLAVMTSDKWPGYAHFPISIFFYCIFLIPLKDIEDISGDVLSGSENWAAALGTKRIILLSASGLTFAVILLGYYFFLLPGFKHLIVLFIGAIFTEVIFLLFRLPVERLYHSIIVMNIVLGLLYLLISNKLLL